MQQQNHSIFTARDQEPGMQQLNPSIFSVVEPRDESLRCAGFGGQGTMSRKFSDPPSTRSLVVPILHEIRVSLHLCSLYT